MDASTLQFCPRCGTKFLQQNTLPLQCEHCAYTLYKNQNLTTAAVIIRQDKLLTVKRALEPHKGMLDLPGGFVEINESPVEGMIREIREELHVEGKILQILGVFGPDPYLYQGETVYNAAACYEVSIGEELPVAGDDAAEIVWTDIKQFDPMLLAFPSQRECFQNIVQGEILLKSTHIH